MLTCLINMRKKEMISEMMNGLGFTNYEKVLKNCLKSNKQIIKDAYNFFLKTKKEHFDRLFCIALILR